MLEQLQIPVEKEIDHSNAVIKFTKWTNENYTKFDKKIIRENTTLQTCALVFPAKKF